MTGQRDMSRELYPFLYPRAIAHGGAHGDAHGDAHGALLQSVRSSVLTKCAEVAALRGEMIAEYKIEIGLAADAMAVAFAGGGKLLAFGNGGSATDADDAVADCIDPPRPAWRALPAISLSADSATVTAVANDVGIASVFSRPLAALGERGDIALGFSTSGNSTNVVAAFREARRRDLLTVALCGYDGGAVSRSGDVDFCFVARREFVPRIQEGHATLWHALLGLVQGALAGQRV